MKRLFWACAAIAGAQFVAPCFAADGTWASTFQGGFWGDMYQWAGQTIAGDGGVATFDFSGQTDSGRISISGDGETYVLGGLNWSSAQPANTDTAVMELGGMVLHLNAPARITRDGGSLSINPYVVETDGDLTLSGPGRTIFNGTQALGGKLRIENGGWARAQLDTSLGPTPATLVPDAVTLDGGTLQNGGDTTLAATRGITLGPNGGALAAGYQKPAKLTVLGPVTGPGELRIAFENSPVMLCNPANDWAGDTVVGTDDCGLKAWSDWNSLLLGADEVIPHGEGHGVLKVGRGVITVGFNQRPQVAFDLNGHSETVNAVDATYQGVVRSAVPGGVLKTCGAQDMDFRGGILAGATVELRGTGRMDLSTDTADVSGTLALHSGSLDFAAGAIRAAGTLVYAGGDARVVARHSADDPSATFPSRLDGALRLDADLTLRVASGAGPLTLAGAVTTDPANPHTLTVVPEDGAPLYVGSPEATSAARLAAPVVCASGVVFRDNVWLSAPLPEGAAVEPGTAFTYGFDGALAADRVLDADVRVACDNPGAGTLTVPTGRTATFTTQGIADNGTVVDGADRTRTFTNPVVLQGGTLAFDGAGTTVFNGAVSGYGTILVSGTGSVILPNGQALEAGCTVDIANGRFLVPANGNLGAATVMTHNGRLGNVPGESATLANPVVANSGGIEVSGADATLTLTGAVTLQAAISKWGDGTLRLAGETANDVQVHVRGGTLALAKAQAVRSVIGCEVGTTVRLEADDAVGTTSDVRVTLGGGTLDLNGHDLAVPTFQMLAAGGLVTNNGSADATLNATAAFTCTGAGAIADGTARVFLRKGGADVTDFTGVGIANSGLVAAAGTVRFAGQAVARATQLRFTTTKARPNGAYAGSGVQFSEFRLLCKGEPVAWPDGTTVTGNSSNPAREGVDKIVDGDVETKWYYGGGVGSPLTITCGADVTFDSYQFATANDAEGRDPVSWRLEIGVERDGGLVWTTLDERTDVADDIPMARKTYGPVYSVDGNLPAHALPEGYALTVDGLATVAFAGADDVLSNLSGTGSLAATGSRSPTIAAPSTFTGTVAGEAPVKLALDTAEIPGFVGTAVGTKLVNDGVAGALTFTDAGTAVTLAGLDDGTAPLGLALAGDTTLVLAGTGGAHTGPTTVGAGSTLIAGAGIFAKWIRFTPIKGSGGQAKQNMQFSELQLLCFGQRLPWPEGTTAESAGSAAYKDEGPLQLLDGSVETKCYWNSAVDAVTIEMPYATYFDGYRWYSGNDSMATRNPVSWTFEYSMDGRNWTLLDEQTDRATTDQIKTLAYTFSAAAEGEVAACDAASDVSPVTVADGGTLTVAGVDETLGGLSGAGALKIAGGAVARFNPTADAVFTGPVSGAGTLAKTGAARQTFSGAVNLDGSVVVEAGVLDLTGATLTGVTRIVLKGGVLVGAATVAGDLTVVSAGGAYNASLAVAGKLTLEGALTLATGYDGSPVRNVAFTFGSTDDASRAVFQAATAVEEVPKAWKLTVTNGDRRMSWSVAPGGSTIYIR